MTEVGFLVLHPLVTEGIPGAKRHPARWIRLEGDAAGPAVAVPLRVEPAVAEGLGGFGWRGLGPRLRDGPVHTGRDDAGWSASSGSLTRSTNTGR